MRVETEPAGARWVDYPTVRLGWAVPARSGRSASGQPAERSDGCSTPGARLGGQLASRQVDCDERGPKIMLQVRRPGPLYSYKISTLRGRAGCPGRRVMRALPTLAELAAHPERVNELAPDQARALLVQLATLQAPLLARALLLGGGRASGDSDELLTVDVAARRLGLSEDWLYRHAGKLPFTVHVGRQVRFSARRLEAYIAAHANGRA